MKIAMGTNVKVIAPEAVRPKVRAMFEALGVTERMSPGDTVDIFTLGDGGNIGYFFVPADDALTEAQHQSGVWLEFRVADVPAARATLDGLSVARVDYDGSPHSYHRAPGGMVFRLAELH